MPEFDLKYLKSLADFSPERKRDLMRFFISQPEEIQVEAFFLMQVNAKHLAQSLKAGKPSESLFACFLIALDKMQLLENAKSRRDETMTKAKADHQFGLKVRRVKAKRQKRTRAKRLIEVQFYDLIKRLHEKEKLSWRQISQFILTNYKESLSFSHLRATYLKLRQIREGS